MKIKTEKEIRRQGNRELFTFLVGNFQQKNTGMLVARKISENDLSEQFLVVLGKLWKHGSVSAA